MLGCLGAIRAAEWSQAGALRYARTNAPDARIAAQRVAGAQAMLRQANAAFWPKVQLASSYTRTDNPVAVFGMALNQRSYSPELNFNRVPDADNLNVRGLVTVPLYAGGRHTAARAAAKAGGEAARAGAEAVGNALEFEVVRAFQTVLKTRRFIEAAESAARSFETNRGLAEKRLNAGALLKADLLDLEVRLSQAQEDLARARHAATLAEKALWTLLGVEAGDRVAADSGPELSAPPVEHPAERPELRAMNLRVDAAEAEVRGARGGHLPTVSAFGQADHDSGWKFNGSGQSYAAGVVAQWDLWDGNATRARVAEARARAEELREEERKLRLGLDLEWEQARLALAESEERLAVSQRTIEQADESASLTRARFEQGLALSSQLIDAETTLTAARVRRAEAESDRRIAVAALRKASGLAQLEEESK